MAIDYFPLTEKASAKVNNLSEKTNLLSFSSLAEEPALKQKQNILVF